MDNQNLIQGGKFSSRFLFAKTTLTLLFLGGLFFSEVQAQEKPKDFILLKRGTSQKSQIRFYPGELITYKSKKLGYFVTDKIVNLDTEFIYLTENILRPEDILEIDIKNKDPRNRTLGNLTGLFLGAGGLLLSVDVINSLYQTGDLSLDSGVAVTSGALLATGLTLATLRYKTFKHEGRNRIQILILTMD